MSPLDWIKPSGRHRLYLNVADVRVGLGSGAVPGRFLALFGVWFAVEEYARFADDLQRLKTRLFGLRVDDPVILRRRDIRGRRGPFARLNDHAEDARFTADLVTTIVRAPFIAVSAVMELAGAPAGGVLPHHACMAAVLKRYAAWLGFHKATGDAMAQCAGAREDRALQEAYRAVRVRGVRHMSKERLQRTLTRTRLLVRHPAGNIAGLQLAGLLGPVVLRQRLVEHLRVRERSDPFDEKLRQVVEGKFNRKEATGQVSGYGTAWILPSGAGGEPEDEKE
ncbi:MAG: hypothetical protein AAB368_04110 [bacterium]